MIQRNAVPVSTECYPVWLFEAVMSVQYPDYTLLPKKVTMDFLPFKEWACSKTSAYRAIPWQEFIGGYLKTPPWNDSFELAFQQAVFALVEFAARQPASRVVPDLETWAETLCEQLENELVTYVDSYLREHDLRYCFKRWQPASSETLTAELVLIDDEPD